MRDSTNLVELLHVLQAQLNEGLTETELQIRSKQIYVVPVWKNPCSETLSLNFPWWLKHAHTCRTVTDWGHGHVPRLAGKPEEQEPSPCSLSSVPQNNLLLLSIGFTSLLGMCLSKEQTPTGPSTGSTRPFFPGYHPPVSNPQGT